MITSTSGVNFIKKWEGLILKSYQCQAGVWTIGYGSTFYQNGAMVRQGETITEPEAEELLRWHLGQFETKVNRLGLNINQAQFDALVSFVFNVGFGALTRSTLLKKIRQHPGDPTIRGEFEKWNKVRTAAGLVPSRGLTRRRKEEANLYFG